MAPPRIRVTASPGWEVLTPAARMRLRAAAESDPFLERVLGDGRLALGGIRSARPRRGAPAGAGFLDARVEAPASPGWVLVARHPSGALTFHAASAIEGGSHRFELRLAPPPFGRRGPGAVLRVFFLRVAGAVAGVLLPALARAWETKRFAEAHVPLGLVLLSAEGGKLVASRIGRPSFPRAKAKGLLFLHGTFSHASAAFSDLARDGGFEALSKLYEGHVFAFNHLTVGRSPQENATALLEAVRGSSSGSSLDVVTHSRGGLVVRLLASSARAPRVNRVFLAASPNEGTPLASPARWDRLAAWLANLGEMFPGGALAFGLDFAAEALVWMASRAGGTLPGIAAMDPAGGLVEKLNAVAARPYEVAAAVARYEPRGSAARRLLDAAAGVFFEDPNDLVVPTEGGARFGAAPPVPEKNVIRFGPGGNAGAGAIVHHLNLFAQRETKQRIKIFLEGKKDDAAVGARVGARHRTNRVSRGPGHPKFPSKHARSASSPRRFELVLVGGKGGTPANFSRASEGRASSSPSRRRAAPRESACASSSRCTNVSSRPSTAAGASPFPPPRSCANTAPSSSRRSFREPCGASGTRHARRRRVRSRSSSHRASTGSPTSRGSSPGIPPAGASSRTTPSSCAASSGPRLPPRPHRAAVRCTFSSPLPSRATPHPWPRGRRRPPFAPLSNRSSRPASCVSRFSRPPRPRVFTAASRRAARTSCTSWGTGPSTKRRRRAPSSSWTRADAPSPSTRTAFCASSPGAR